MKRLTKTIGKIMLAGVGVTALTYLIYQCPNQKEYRRFNLEFQEYKTAVTSGLPNQQVNERELYLKFLETKKKEEE
jgi:hypothetical protein